MRPVAFVLLAASLLALPWMAIAQQAPTVLRAIDDPANDSGFTAGGQPTGQDRWAAADLRSLDVAETTTGLVLTLGVRGLGTETTTLVDSVSYDLELVARDAPYRISAYYDGEAGSVQATWCAPDGGPFYRCFEELAAVADAAAGTLAFTVPHRLLVASDGALLLKGDLVGGFAVFAESVGALLVSGYTTGAVQANDHMPDSGVSTATWAIQSGTEQVGHILAAAKTPVRVSNGEATTFLFELTLKNTLDRRDTVALAATGVPGIWTVTFPQEEVRIEGGDTADVPVLVTVPFNHQHGIFLSFNVTATSRSDPLAVGQVQLGVRYTRVPQPAGHHDTLWLHEQGSQFYINALEEEEIPADEQDGGGLGGGCGFSGGSVSGSSTLVSLVPGLQIGLDAAMDRVGEATIVLRSDLPVLGGASVGGYFITWNGDEYPETCAYEAPPGSVLQIDRSEPLTMDANTPITVKLPIRPLPFGDRIEYDPDLRFGLLLVTYQESGSFPICCPDVGTPEFVAGSSFQLPLDEYHDPVDEYFSTLSGIDLLATTEQQRAVNAGETVVFRVEAHNLGTKAASFDLELTGTHSDWARILGDVRVSVPAGSIRELGVAVAVPAGTTSGETADVTLHAVKSDDDNVRSLIRLLATVDDAVDHPDEAGDVQGIDDDLTGQEAPAAPWVPLLALLGAALLGRRRHL